MRERARSRARRGRRPCRWRRLHRTGRSGTAAWSSVWLHRHRPTRCVRRPAPPCRRSCVNTYSASGWGRSLTNVIASSTSLTAITGRIGPKISSCITAAVGLDAGEHGRREVPVVAVADAAGDDGLESAGVEQPGQPVVVALVDDAAVVGRRLRVLAVEVVDAPQRVRRGTGPRHRRRRARSRARCTSGRRS